MEKELSHDALYMFLKDKYNERVGDMINLGYNGSVYTTLDGKKFTIVYDKSYMLLSTNIDTKEVIDELKPTLSEYMKAKPICSFDLSYFGDDKNYIPSVEWDTLNPNHRLKLIINDNAFTNAKTYNIRLYNGRNISDYIDNSKILKKK